MKQFVLLLSIVFFISACGDQKIDTTKARQEMEAREIKRVSDGQIVEKALNKGNEITKGLSLVKGPNSDLIINLKDEDDKRVGFLELKELQNASDNSKRFQVYDAYAYNIENDIRSEAGIQILEGDTILLYTKPAYYDKKQVGLFIIDFSRKEIVLSIQ